MKFKKKKKKLEEILEYEYMCLESMTPGTEEYEKLSELILKQEETLKRSKINSQVAADLLKVLVTLGLGIAGLKLQDKHFKESLKFEETGAYTSYTGRQVAGDELKKKKLF